MHIESIVRCVHLHEEAKIEKTAPTRQKDYWFWLHIALLWWVVWRSARQMLDALRVHVPKKRKNEEVVSRPDVRHKRLRFR